MKPALVLALALAASTALAQNPPAIAWIPDLERLPVTTSELILRIDSYGTGVPSILEEDLDRLTRFRALRRLDLSRAGPRGGATGVGGSRWDLRLTDDGLRRIAKLASLEDLALPDCPTISDEGLEALAKGTPRLRRLRVRWWGAFGATNHATLAPLSGLAALEDLDLRGCAGTLDRAWPMRIATLPAIRRLDVGHCAWARKGGLAPLARLPVLDEIHVAGIESEDLKPVPRLGRLSTLVVRDSPRLESLDSLAAARSLRAIDTLGCIRIGDQALADISGLRLRAIRIGGDAARHRRPGPITDEGLRCLARIETLRRIEIVGVKKTVRGCAPKPLVVDYPLAITDEGLAALATLDSLESLTIVNAPGITREGAVAFRKARPGCELRLLEATPRAE